MPEVAKASWHLARGSEKFGPFTSQQLAAMGKAGRITSDMLVWQDGMEKWQPVSKVKGLLVTPVAPPPPPSVTPAITVAVTPSPSSPPMPVTGHVTIEKTKKSLKLQKLLSFVSIVLGITLVFAGMNSAGPESKEPSSLLMTGSLLFVLGLAWWIITRMRIWWNHG